MCGMKVFFRWSVWERKRNPPPPIPFSPLLTSSYCHYFRWCPPLISRAFWGALSPSLSAPSCPFHLSGAPFGGRRWRGFDFPSCLASPPLTHSLPVIPLRRELCPRVVGQLSPGVMRSVSPLCTMLTDTSPTHLSTNQTAGVGDRIELRVVVGREARAEAHRASLSLCFSLSSSIPSSLSLPPRYLWQGVTRSRSHSSRVSPACTTVYLCRKARLPIGLMVICG